MLDLHLRIVGVTLIVVTSYRQTIRAYPNGGGAYIVATDNLGFLPGLVGGSALLVDYVMTVAVSVAAGVAAITSAAPALYGIRVEISVVFVVLLIFLVAQRPLNDYRPSAILPLRIK